jgi:hypothetical protein
VKKGRKLWDQQELEELPQKHSIQARLQVAEQRREKGMEDQSFVGRKQRVLLHVLAGVVGQHLLP